MPPVLKKNSHYMASEPYALDNTLYGEYDFVLLPPAIGTNFANNGISYLLLYKFQLCHCGINAGLSQPVKCD